MLGGMRRADIVAGAEYAYREPPRPGVAMQHIRVVQHVRDYKWRAEWIDPNEGLVAYVDSRGLIVEWSKREPVLRDEAATKRLREHHPPSDHAPVDLAVHLAVESSKERAVFFRGELQGSPDSIERLKVRAGLDPGKSDSLAFVDRHGEAHLPFDEALEIARGFCSKEPSAIVAEIEVTEREWSAATIRPGKEYLVGLLNEYRAAHALIRQWTGMDAAVAQREVHIQRLERLVWDAVYALQRAGLDDEASRLRKALTGRYGTA
jgi:hypothetical protein